MASFTDGNGRKVSPGDRVGYRFGAMRGTLVEVFSDGDAYVRFDGHTRDELVKWHHLCLAPTPQQTDSETEGDR